MILFFTFIIFCTFDAFQTTSIGINLDKKFHSIGSNFEVLKEKYSALEKELDGMRAILNLKSCAPCRANQFLHKGACDCTNLKPKRDCLEFRNDGMRIDGVYKISLGKFTTIQVFCDQTTDDGGWIVFQRRIDGSVDFNRTWDEYREGFGEVDREHWLGNDNIHMLTKSSINPNSTTLMVNMEMKRNHTKESFNVTYDRFYIDSESQNYRLSINGFSGDWRYGDPIGADYYRSKIFSTKDRNSLYWCQNNFWEDRYRGCSSAKVNVEFNEMKWTHTSLISVELKFRRNE